MEEVAQKDGRLQELEDVDKKILAILTSAAACLNELGKDKPVNKTSENHVQSFLKGLEEVDRVLAQKISHLGQISSGGTHEGTHYDCAKEREMNLRCSSDIQNYLAFLMQERNKYLLQVASESPIQTDLDHPMDSPENGSG